MNSSKTKRKLNRLAIEIIALVICAILFVTGFTAAQAAFIENGGKFYLDYARADALAAAQELNIALSDEGNVLLKNENNALPLKTREKISVFGVAQDSMSGGSGNVGDMLSEQGFTVNNSLLSYYKSVGTTLGSETTSFAKNITQSFDLYNDVAVIFISRGGEEGGDVEHNTGEKENDADENIGGWSHKELAKDKDGTYKHALMLTKSEYDLIDLVKEYNFKKTIFVLSTANIIEMYNVQHNPDIDAVLSIGRPGNTGLASLGRILNGSVNPSGRLVDNYVTDFSADPTWKNFGFLDHVGSSHVYTDEEGEIYGEPGVASGNSTGYFGVDYEEDIYMGYRYYETYYYDMLNGDAAVPAGYADADDWFSKTVVYPFGFGLSYSDFEYGQMEVFTSGSLKTVLSATPDAADFASSANNPAKIKTLYIKVPVTNNGDVEGKEVVQIYITAPYTKGGTEKAAVVLSGYSKSDFIAPGATEDVIVEVNVQDFASYDAIGTDGNKGYELDAGKYTIRAMRSSHIDKTIDQYADFEFTLGAEANLKLDDFSGNEIVNVFSKENGDYYTLRDNSDPEYQINKSSTAGMTLMTRSNFVTSYPVAPTEDDRMLSDDFVAYFRANYDHFEADTLVTQAAEENQPWYIDRVDFNALTENWTQSTSKDYDSPNSASNPLHTYQLSDMAGVDFQSTAVISDGLWKNRTGVQAWEIFMNQFTWNELAYMQSSGSAGGGAIPSIGLVAFRAGDAPNSFAGYTWCCESVIAQTYNTELAHRQGILVGNLGISNGNYGWNGPGINIHRSPFSGRNNDYYSQDGFQGGKIAAAVVSGAESRGLSVFSKHCFLNDQESGRDENCLFTWASEQAIREIYAKGFQMAFQEGRGTGLMSAFNRVGRVPAAVNWALNTALIRNEWGSTLRMHTDMWSGEQGNTPLDLMVRSGHDMPYGSGSANDPLAYKKGARVSGVWDATLRNGKGGVVCGSDAKAVTDADGKIISPAGTGAYESWIQYYYVRLNVMRILFNNANSSVIKNGISFTAFSKAANVEFVQGVSKTESVALTATALAGSTANYSAANLPSGLSVNAAGSITGTTYVAPGNYTATITATCDGWVTGTKAVTINVVSAIGYTGDDVSKLKTGESFDGVLAYTGSTNYTSTTFTATGLPAGISLLSSGAVTGTPTEAGTFNAAVSVACVTGRNTHTYLYTLTLKVEGNSSGSNIESKIAELEKAISELKNGASASDIEALEAELQALKDAGYSAKITALENDLKALKESVEDGGGCGSVIGGSAIAIGVAFILGVAILIIMRKKRA